MISKQNARLQFALAGALLAALFAWCALDPNAPRVIAAPLDWLDAIRRVDTGPLGDATGRFLVRQPWAFLVLVGLGWAAVRYERRRVTTGSARSPRS